MQSVDHMDGRDREHGNGDGPTLHSSRSSMVMQMPFFDQTVSLCCISNTPLDYYLSAVDRSASMFRNEDKYLFGTQPAFLIRISLKF